MGGGTKSTTINRYKSLGFNTQPTILSRNDIILRKRLGLFDLSLPEFTRDKCSILYYKSKITLDAYLELKERQSELIESDLYDARAQLEISVAFMELLSYPPGVIQSKLSGIHPDPFVLIEKS